MKTRDSKLEYLIMIPNSGNSHFSETKELHHNFRPKKNHLNF